MNLKQLFNKNFFLENIKKSKGILAFLLGIVPLLNILTIIICLFNEFSILTFKEVSLVTHLGMYIIPIVLAVSLFGFLFKQKSVDFIMSKPISRKTIYFTNIIGGIIILTIFMLINTFIYGIFGILFSSLIIPFKLLIDYLIFYLISYIFMYTVISLAIVFSGNLITSIVVLLIILLIYPFSTLAWGYLTNSYSMHYIKCTDKSCQPLNYECYSKECKEELKNNNYYFYLDKEIGDNYTTPVKIFKGLNNIYSDKIIIKMVILSGLYLILGYKVFKKRKMEDNEISFKDEFKHYLVKSITFIPVCLITYFLMSELGFIGLLIGIALSFIYYVVYDLITRKEIYKFGKSLLIFIISFGILNGTYAIIDKHEINHILNVNDIKSIVLKHDSGLKYEVTNKEIINKIIKSTLSEGNTLYSYYDSQLITKNGKYNLSIDFVDDQLYQEVNTYIENEIKNIILNYNYNNIDAIMYGDVYIPVTNKVKELIKNSINKYKYIDKDYIKISDYHNHEYENILIPLSINEDLYEYIFNYLNNKIVENLKRDNNFYNYYLIEYNYASTNKYFTDFDQYIFEYVLKNNIDSFIHFLENDNKISYTNNYIVIECYGYNSYYRLRISDVLKFKKEFDKYKEKVKNNKEYQALVKEYQESSVTYEY